MCPLCSPLILRNSNWTGPKPPVVIGRYYWSPRYPILWPYVWNHHLPYICASMHAKTGLVSELERKTLHLVGILIGRVHMDLLYTNITIYYICG